VRRTTQIILVAAHHLGTLLAISFVIAAIAEGFGYCVILLEERKRGDEW